MRTRVVVFISLFSMAVVVKAQEKSERINLVANPSFEQLDAAGLATSWTPHKSYTISDKTALEGSKSLLASGKDVYYCGARTLIDVPKPGCKLLFKAHIYIKEFQSGIIKPIHVSYTDGQGKKHYQPHINLYPNNKDLKFNEWVEYKAVLDLSQKPEVEKVIFWCLGYHNPKKEKFTGTVLFDDVSVEVAK